MHAGRRQRLRAPGQRLPPSPLQRRRAEREDLRKTIDELRDERTTHVASITRLEALPSSKDNRIRALEQFLQHLTEKLPRGEVIRLEDVLGASIVTKEAAALTLSPGAPPSRRAPCSPPPRSSPPRS